MKIMNLLCYNTLAMEYKNQSGLYRIKNNKTDQEYVGSSKDVNRRFSEHKNSLKRGKHSNYKLQQCYDIFGSDIFTYEIIKFCDIEEALKLEQSYLNEKDPFYNISEVVSCPQPFTKSVLQYSLEGIFIKKFSSLQEAALFVKGDRSSISKACLGKIHAHKGYCWKHKTGDIEAQIEPSSASNRQGMKWFEFWKKGNYRIYKWDLQGNLITTYSNIQILSEELNLSINYITSHFRGDKKTIYNHTYSLNEDRKMEFKC